MATFKPNSHENETFVRYASTTVNVGDTICAISLLPTLRKIRKKKNDLNRPVSACTTFRPQKHKQQHQHTGVA